MKELKEFEVGLGQMFEDGSPVVIAVDENNNPRLLGKEKVYLKYEADKVIAEQKERYFELQDTAIKIDKELTETRKQLSHQKYKRCLAMARWCDSEEKRLEAIAPIFDSDKECWEYNSDYWYKWHKRWRKIAGQFKEAK